MLPLKKLLARKLPLRKPPPKKLLLRNNSFGKPLPVL